MQTGRSGSLLDWQGTDRYRRCARFLRDHVTIPHGFGAGQPMTLHPTQRVWVRAIIARLVVVISIAKGNAKSSTLAALALWWAVDPPLGDIAPEIVIVSGSKLQAQQSVYSTCVAMVEQSEWLVERTHVYTDVNDPRIEFANGAVIRLRAPSPKRLHGIILSLGILDEIGLIDDAQVFNTLVESLGKRPGATVVGIGTPGWERGALWDIKVASDTGALDERIAFLEHAAAPDASSSDRAAWRAANPVRRELDPVGWEQTLAVIKGTPTVTDADFRIFHLCQWPDLRGTPIVDGDAWDALTPLTGDPSEMDVYVAIDGDWSRRNIAVVAVAIDDDIANVTLCGLWESQSDQVPIAEMLAAVYSLGTPMGVHCGRSVQAVELTDTLEADGVAVEILNTSTAAAMRDPTDVLLARIGAATLRHDGHDLLRSQFMGARQDPRKDGIVLMRDDRLEQRIDAVVATAVALFEAANNPASAVW